jgi:hypothetical protein
MPTSGSRHVCGTAGFMAGRSCGTPGSLTTPAGPQVAFVPLVVGCWFPHDLGAGRPRGPFARQQTVGLQRRLVDEPDEAD